jgi:ubiquinone/menaquinone biosynthesis C-methylase UbiE
MTSPMRNLRDGAKDMEQLPKLYSELADWWPVLSAPEDYAEEAAFYEQALRTACAFEPKTLLELGSGGGNNASYLKKHFQVTLVDLAPGMLAVSQALNPECEHHQGDMRTVRLDRQFDLVFIQDAIVYMTTEADLRQAMQTAYLHCHPGGAVLFAPDHTKENFKTQTGHGGHDRGGRSLRYLDWTLEPNPDGTYLYVMAYLLREGTGEVRCILDQHCCGLFSRTEWLQWMKETGFEACGVPFVHSEIPPGDCEVFVGRKPAHQGMK